MRVTFHGTHRGELLAVPPTGRQVTVPGIGIYHVVDGQVAEEWIVRDLLGLLQQLAPFLYRRHPAPEGHD